MYKILFLIPLLVGSLWSYGAYEGPGQEEVAIKTAEVGPGQLPWPKAEESEDYETNAIQTADVRPSGPFVSHGMVATAGPEQVKVVIKTQVEIVIKAVGEGPGQGQVVTEAAEEGPGQEQVVTEAAEEGPGQEQVVIEAVDVVPPNYSMRECAAYQSNTNTFKFSDVSFSLEHHPFRQWESCLLTSIDRSLKPICDEEARVKSLMWEHNYSDEDLKELEEYLDHLSQVKYEYADILYEQAEVMDGWVNDWQEGLEEKFKEDWLHALVYISVTREVNYVNLVTVKASSFCGSTLSL